MEKVIKLTILTLIVLEVLSILTHIDALFYYLQYSLSSLVPIIIVAAGIYYIVKSIL